VILKKLLLPSYCKIIGYILTITGIFCSYVRFGLGIKPAFLEVKVFAIYSSIFQARYFSPVYNNISEEICGVLLLSGLFLMTFSRERQEQNSLWRLRYRSMFLAVFINTLLLLFATLFFFGLGFLVMMTLHLFSLLLIYNIIFFIARIRSKRSTA